MVVKVTDPRLLRLRLERAHARAAPGATFLIDAVAADIVERLAAVERRFATAVVQGGRTDALAAAVATSGKAGMVIRMERVAAALAGARQPAMAGDCEALPFAPASIDLFVSCLDLQWANDLPGALAQIRRALRPDGLFLAALAGGETLAELRTALALAESELSGGAALRVLPMADVRDLGALLQRAGFALPVADRDRLAVRYADALALMRDLRGMGATAALAERERRPPARRLFARAAGIYAERFADPDGRIPATFDIVSLSGWAPHESQQKPARRGSGEISLADALPPRRRG